MLDRSRLGASDAALPSKQETTVASAINAEPLLRSSGFRRSGGHTSLTNAELRGDGVAMLVRLPVRVYEQR
jgi:hypothetical protein